MKAIVLTKNGLVARNRHSPTLSGKDVLVEVVAVGLCGSDIKKIQDSVSYRAKLPVVLGHEVAGRKDGANMAVLPFLGFDNMKPEGTFAYLESIGKNKPGGFQQLITVPNGNLFTLSPSISPIEATMADPLAVVLHGFSKLGEMNGARIGIVGDGPIGLLATQMLSKENTVFLVGKHRRNLRVAEEYGASPVKLASAKKLSAKFDIAIESAGTADSLDACFDITRPGGKVLVFGAFPSGKIQLEIRGAFYKELTIIGTNSYGFSGGANEFQQALELLETKKIDVKNIITHVILFQDFSRINSLLENKGNEGAIKIVLTW